MSDPSASSCSRPSPPARVPCRTCLQLPVTSGTSRGHRHEQNETLYWTKAASVLGLAQRDMLDSEVPIPAARARADLRTLILENTPPPHSLPDDDRDLVFEGWRLLCHAHRPVFLEKSPHHLVHWSNLELLLEAVERLTDVDFLFVGPRASPTRHPALGLPPLANTTRRPCNTSGSRRMRTSAGWRRSPRRVWRSCATKMSSPTSPRWTPSPGSAG